MMAFLEYDVKVAVLIAVFYTFYRLLLAKDSFHRLNRVVLLLTAVLSFALPVCVITFHRTMVVKSPAVSVETPVVKPLPNVMPLPRQKSQPLRRVVADKAVASPVLPTLLTVLFFLGMAALLIRSFVDFLKIKKLIHDCDVYPRADGIRIAVSPLPIAPFSWMRTIVLSRQDYEEGDEAILMHELGHIRCHHSVDVVLVEALTALQWFNPAMWMLRSDLRAIHEYEADRQVLSSGFNTSQYLHLLIRKAVGMGGYSLVNGFNHSTLIRRINMITNPIPRGHRWLKALYILPVILCSLAITARVTTHFQSASKGATSNGTNVNDVNPIPYSDSAASVFFGKTHIMFLDMEGIESEQLVTSRTFHKNNREEIIYYSHWGDPPFSTIKHLFVVGLPQNCWVEVPGMSYREDICLRWQLNDQTTTMKLDGRPFDLNHLPKLPSSALKKMEVKYGGKGIIVNLITKDVTVPASIKGNVNPVITILLPGENDISFGEGIRRKGEWVAAGSSWEKKDRYGLSGIRRQLRLRQNLPDFHVYVYASTETTQQEIDRMTAIFKELNIGSDSFEIVKNLSKTHLTDAEMREWALQHKREGTKYDDLLGLMINKGVDYLDIRAQWHIVKAVYGKK